MPSIVYFQDFLVGGRRSCSVSFRRLTPKSYLTPFVAVGRSLDRDARSSLGPPVTCGHSNDQRMETVDAKADHPSDSSIEVEADWMDRTSGP